MESARVGLGGEFTHIVVSIGPGTHVGVGHLQLPVERVVLERGGVAHGVGEQDEIVARIVLVDGGGVENSIGAGTLELLHLRKATEGVADAPPHLLLRVGGGDSP